MKPHMMHIASTLARKELTREAINHESAYATYKRKVKEALERGFSLDRIIDELLAEKDRIWRDPMRDGDALFKQGVQNTKTSCMNAINLVISELRGDNPEGDEND